MARDPKAEIEISAHSRSLGARLREARAKLGKFGDDVKKELFGKVTGARVAAGAIRGLAGLAGTAGGFIADQAHEVFAFEQTLTRLGIAANKTPEEMHAFAKSVRGASNETGLAAGSILGAAKAYVALTGDMKGAEAATRTWARVAQATDSNIDDVARTAASLKQNLKIDPGDMEASFSALAVQGKEGAIELKDLAAQLSNIAPQWAMFKGGTGVQGLKEMGAALQVVKQGFGGDASETVTGLQSFLTAVTKNARHFGLKNIFDVDPKTGKKTMKNVLEIVDAIANSKLVQDPTKLEKAFGRVEAYRAFLQLSQNKQLLDDLVTKAGDASVIQRDLNRYMSTPAAKIEQAWAKMKNTIAEAFTPERIELFGNALVKVVELGAKVVGFIERIADKVESIRGPSVEKRSEDMYKKTAAFQKRLPMSREAMLARAGQLEQEAANLYHKRGGMNEDDQVNFNVNQRLADDLRRRADVWGEGSGMTGPGFDQKAFASRYAMANPNKLEKYDAQFVAPIADAMRRALDEINRPMLDALSKQTDELKKQTETLAKGTKVAVDGKDIVQAHKGSAAHARRPGG